MPPRTTTHNQTSSCAPPLRRRCYRCDGRSSTRSPSSVTRRTYLFFDNILHTLGASHETAAVAIAGELATTSADPPLHLTPKHGLRDGYAALDQLAQKLGLTFVEHDISVSIAGESFTAKFHLLSFLSCCKLLFGRCTPEHCKPVREYDASGARVYSTSYSCEWVEEAYDEVHSFDPHGLLFAVSVGWDKSSLSTFQSAYPLYIKANAWPLEEQNKVSRVGPPTHVTPHARAPCLPP